MNNKHLILGFDIREMCLNLSENLDGKEQDNFLYRLDIKKPLSVDPIIWPSVFDIYSNLKKTDRGFYQDLWEDLHELMVYSENCIEISSRRHCVIAISLLIEACNQQEKETWYSLLKGVNPCITGCSSDNNLPIKKTKPEKPNNNWTIIGYDVADQWGISAISNCGFLPEDNTQELRRKWGPCLNNFHLFDSFDRAKEFKNFADAFIPEHSFFSVFAIWKITEKEE